MHNEIHVNPVTVVNLFIALVIVGLSVFYWFKGRPVDKGMMLINFIAGFWSSLAIAIIIYDRACDDIFPEEVTRWLISITMFVVLFAKLSNLVRIGRRDGQ